MYGSAQTEDEGLYYSATICSTGACVRKLGSKSAVPKRPTHYRHLRTYLFPKELFLVMYLICMIFCTCLVVYMTFISSCSFYCSCMLSLFNVLQNIAEYCCLELYPMKYFRSEGWMIHFSVDHFSVEHYVFWNMRGSSG